MPESFNPYRKWLGIPPTEQPANHYRLLGIAEFEEDADVIAYAADRQMSHVRKFQSGANGPLAQKLLSELANARRCLLAADERIAYDAKLRKQLGSVRSSNVAKPQAVKPVPAPAPSPPVASPPVATMEPPKAVPVAVASTPSPSPVAVRPRGGVSTARRGRKKNNMVPLIVALCVLAGLAGVVLVLVVAATNDPAFTSPSDGGQNYAPPTTRVQQPDVPPVPQPERPKPDRPKPPAEENDKPQPNEPAVTGGPATSPSPDEPRDIRDEINQTPPEDLPQLPDSFPGTDTLPKPGGAERDDTMEDEDE